MRKSKKYLSEEIESIKQECNKRLGDISKIVESERIKLFLHLFPKGRLYDKITHTDEDGYRLTLNNASYETVWRNSIREIIFPFEFNEIEKYRIRDGCYFDACFTRFHVDADNKIRTFLLDFDLNTATLLPNITTDKESEWIKV